jgi:hypothetical protein
MMFPWVSAALLSAESGHVIGLRLSRIALGGAAAIDECFLMVNEKIDAALEAQVAMVAGGSAATVIERYREHVASNEKRLRLS